MARRVASDANASPFQFPRGWLARFQPALVRWYAERARPLPWRDSRDPYRIWVSEVMLQQTTVTAVVPYFERFLARFPTVTDLAEAPEDEVLRQWEGLGYYSRARNLQKAARQIVAPTTAGGCGGTFPITVDGWVALPGVGRYTAGAIVGFAYDTPAPIVEANTQRLYARLMGYEGELKTSAGQKLLWDFAERILPNSQPGLFNQALMELGSLVCRPADPACDTCPVATCCRAAADGTQTTIPRPMKRPEITDLNEYAVVIEQNDACLLMRWNPGERWAGLWDFVRFGADQLTDAESDPPSPDDLAAAVAKTVGELVHVGPCFHELTHGVTRYRIHLRAYRAKRKPMPSGGVPSGRTSRKTRKPGESSQALVGDSAIPPRETAWVPLAQLADYPLSVSARKIATVLTHRRDGLFHDDW